MFDVRAKAHQQYLAHLKGGTRSGISETFRSAEDLFSTPVKAPPIPRLDKSGLHFDDPDQFEWRGIYFVQVIRAFSLDYLLMHIQNSRSGSFGAAMQKKAGKQLSVETFRKSVKELCCVQIWLTAIEQEAVGSQAQEWLLDFFGMCFSIADQLLDEPPSQYLLQTNYNFEDPGKISTKAASAIGRQLGFGDIGTHAWNGLRADLLRSGEQRFTCLRTALLTRMPELDEKLKGVNEQIEELGKAFSG